MGVFNSSKMAEEKPMMERIEGFLDRVEFMNMLEEKAGIKKLYIAAGLVAVLVLFILFCFGAALLCNFVGFVYPAYASFKALESNNSNDDRLWLTYWVVYSCFCLVEGFLEIVLYWVPFYFPIKLGFLFYLFLPQTKGAQKLYDVVLRPALKPYIGIIDGATTAAMDKVQGAKSAVDGMTSGSVGVEAKKAD